MLADPEVPAKTAVAVATAQHPVEGGAPVNPARSVLDRVPAEQIGIASGDRCGSPGGQT